MSIYTRDKIYLSADKQTYLQYDPGTNTLSFYVNGTLVQSSTASLITVAIAMAFANTGLGILDAGGDHKVTLAPAGDEAANRTLGIPLLGGNDTLMTLALAQTVAGIKTFSAMPRFPVTTVAAAGSAQGDAAALVEGINLVTGPDDNKGVKLPAAVGGQLVIIKVGDGEDLKVYPSTGDTINKGSANAAITVVDDVSFAVYSVDATDWYTLPLLPS